MQGHSAAEGSVGLRIQSGFSLPAPGATTFPKVTTVVNWVCILPNEPILMFIFEKKEWFKGGYRESVGW